LQSRQWWCSGTSGSIGDGRYIFGDDGSANDGLHFGSPLWYAPANLYRDASHMCLGTSL
jgi:hypothetical protein